jgi:hypothetical protein
MAELYYSDAATARKLVDVVVSLDALGEGPFKRHMATANFSGAQPTLTTLAQVHDRLTEVEEAVRSIAGHPGEYLRIVTRALRAIHSILKNEGRPYLELVHDICDLDHTPIPDSEAEALKQQLDQGLSELGYKGPLQQKVTTWLTETSLTGEAVIDLAKQVVAATRQDTFAKVLQLPDTEGLDSISGVRNVHYSGRSQYTGGHRGWLHFNIDKHWQKDMFIQVLCHEGYPGHQTFYCLWDVLYQQGKWPLEAAYYHLLAPNNAVFEGGPEVAMHFIGRDEGESREARALRTGQAFKDLHRIGMNNACLWANTGEMTRDQALAYMEQHMVLRDDAERAYTFMTHPLSRYNYVQYYYGRRIVNLAFQRFEGSEAGRQQFWEILYRTPHTTSTFVNAVAAASGAPFNPFKYG